MRCGNPRISPPPIRSRVGVSESSATNVRNSFVASSLPSELRIDPHVIGFLAHEDFCRNARFGHVLNRGIPSPLPCTLANRVVVSSANNAATATHPVTVTHQGSLNMYSVCLKIMRLLFDFRTTIQPRVGQRPSCGNNSSLRLSAGSPAPATPPFSAPVPNLRAGCQLVPQNPSCRSSRRESAQNITDFQELERTNVCCYEVWNELYLASTHLPLNSSLVTICPKR